MFTRILAALDFSAPSDAALAHARALAAAFDARLHLLHVLPVVRSAPCPVLTVRTPPSGEGFTNILVPAGGASEQVRTVARAIAARSGGSFFELDGLEEARSIAEYAADIGFDPIGMGTASRTGLSHVTGTLAERVIRSTGCPGIAVPPTAAVARKIIHTAAKNVPAAVGR